MSSRPVKTVAPVVVNPDTDSNTAFVIERSGIANKNGKAEKMDNAIHDMAVNKNACRPVISMACCLLPRIRRKPQKADSPNDNPNAFHVGFKLYISTKRGRVINPESMHRKIPIIYKIGLKSINITIYLKTKNGDNLYQTIPILKLFNEAFI